MMRKVFDLCSLSDLMFVKYIFKFKFLSNLSFLSNSAITLKIIVASIIQSNLQFDDTKKGS